MSQRNMNQKHWNHRDAKSAKGKSKRSRIRADFAYQYEQHSRSKSQHSLQWLRETERLIMHGAIAWLIEMCIESHLDKVSVADFAASRGNLDGLNPESFHASLFWDRFLKTLGLPDHSKYEPILLSEEVFRMAQVIIQREDISTHYRPHPVIVSVWLSPPGSELVDALEALPAPTAPPLQGGSEERDPSNSADPSSASEAA